MIINAVEGRVIQLGRLGENEARKVKFLIGNVLYEHPGATFTVVNMRKGDAAAYPVPAGQLSAEGNILYWNLTSADLSKQGEGKCELIAMDGEKICKSWIYETFVDAALDGSGTPPEPWVSWVQEVTDAAEQATAAAALLENASAAAETLEPGESATASYANGVFTFGIPRGAAGQDGQDGKDGKDGTDGKDGQDGQNGQDGAPGADGFSPSASVSKSGDTATIAITDKTGTTTATVKDGYQPVNWELIVDGTQTNATEADIVIDRDGNGQPFQLTDIRMIFWTPQQDNAAGKQDYGRVFFYEGNTQKNAFYWNAWTQSAGAAGRIADGEIIQQDGMVVTTYTRNNSINGDSNIMATVRSGTTDPRHWALPAQSHTYTKIVVTKVTGKANYRIYGKRKPTT